MPSALTPQLIGLMPWMILALCMTGFIVAGVLCSRRSRAWKGSGSSGRRNDLKRLDLLYTLIHSVPDWIYIKDRESRFILSNKHLAHSHGIEDPEEMTGKTDFDYYPEAMARTFFNDEQTIMKSGESMVNKEEKVLNGLNREVIISTTKIPVRDTQGAVAGIVGIGRDITPQKEVEKRLEQLSMVASATENVVVVMDREGNFEWVNKGFESRYGCSLDEFIQKRGRNLLENSANENIRELLQEIYQTRKPRTYSSRTLDAEGKDVWYQTNITPILSQEGEITSLFLIDSDITAIKKADLQIKQQKYELESQRDQLHKLNARKDRLFSIIAHDLKNPFQAILGFSDILKEGHQNLSEQQVQEYLNCIHDASLSAYDLLFNLLEWARAQIKSIEIVPENIAVRSMIQEIVELLSLQARNKQISIENVVDPGLEIRADRNMVHTILRNLTSNAIKFTTPGGMVAFDAYEHENLVNITVRDSGVGIPEEKIKTLFSLDQGKRTRGTAGETGTGLGLLVCKEFLELNKGTIRVSSAPGTGSTFTVTVPGPNS